MHCGFVTRVATIEEVPHPHNRQATRTANPCQAAEHWRTSKGGGWQRRHMHRAGNPHRPVIMKLKRSTRASNSGARPRAGARRERVAGAGGGAGAVCTAAAGRAPRTKPRGGEVSGGAQVDKTAGQKSGAETHTHGTKSMLPVYRGRGCTGELVHAALGAASNIC